MRSLAGWLAMGDCWMDVARVRRWTWCTLVCQLVVLALLVLATHGLIVTLDGPCTTDFVSFYAAGVLANGPDPRLVYDHAAHFLVEQAATARGIPYVHFFYPPVYLLICGLLAHLPYLASFLLFEFATTCCCLLVLRSIVGPDLHGWWLPVLSFSPLFWNVGFGQNACLTTSLFGLGTLLLHRRCPVAAGLAFSCLLYKPHTGLLIPVALAASGSRRAFIAAVGGVCVLGLFSVLTVGSDAWASFVEAITSAERNFAAGHIVSFVTTASVYGATRMVGGPVVLAYAVEIAVAALVVSALIWSWRRPDDGSGARYATLVAGTQLVMPVVLFYDTVSLLVAGAWLIRADRLAGARTGERFGLGAIWLLALLCYPLTRATHVPIAVMMAVGMFALSLRRQVAGLPNRKNSPPVSPVESGRLSTPHVQPRPKPPLRSTAASAASQGTDRCSTFSVTGLPSSSIGAASPLSNTPSSPASSER